MNPFQRKMNEMLKKQREANLVSSLGDRPIPFTLKEDNELAMYPYPVEARQVACGVFGWKWEVKIEEIGILCYSENREEAFKAAMKQYDHWLKK